MKFKKFIYWKVGKVYDMLYPVKYAIDFTEDKTMIFYVKYDIGGGKIIHAKLIDNEYPECEYVSEGHTHDEPFESSVSDKIKMKNFEGDTQYRSMDKAVESLRNSYFSQYKDDLDVLIKAFYEKKFEEQE